jgi:hypothetical protein
MQGTIMDNLESPGNSSLPFNSLDTSDPLFHLCWQRQSCSTCLAGDDPCSWCAIVGDNLVSFSTRYSALCLQRYTHHTLSSAHDFINTFTRGHNSESGFAFGSSHSLVKNFLNCCFTSQPLALSQPPEWEKGGGFQGHHATFPPGCDATNRTMSCILH